MTVLFRRHPQLHTIQLQKKICHTLFKVEGEERIGLREL